MTISTHSSLRSVLDEIRHRPHATSGFVIALAGAASAALGQAVVGVSGGETKRLGEIALALRDWADDDAAALQKALALRAEGREEEGWDGLLVGPVAIGDLACEGAEALKSFRPILLEHIRDDLDFAVVLLAATARSALLLLESNLRQYRLANLHARYGPETERLSQRIEALQPVEHIRWR